MTTPTNPDAPLDIAAVCEEAAQLIDCVAGCEPQCLRNGMAARLRLAAERVREMEREQTALMELHKACSNVRAARIAGGWQPGEPVGGVWDNVMEVTARCDREVRGEKEGR